MEWSTSSSSTTKRPLSITTHPAVVSHPIRRAPLSFTTTLLHIIPWQDRQEHSLTIPTIKVFSVITQRYVTQYN